MTATTVTTKCRRKSMKRVWHNEKFVWRNKVKSDWINKYIIIIMCFDLEIEHGSNRFLFRLFPISITVELFNSRHFVICVARFSGIGWKFHYPLTPNSPFWLCFALHEFETFSIFRSSKRLLNALNVKSVVKRNRRRWQKEIDRAKHERKVEKKKMP